VYDVALHRQPVVFCIDRAGITGDDGPSHHGVFDMALLSNVPGMTVLAPSSVQELQVMVHDALELCTDGPVAIRYPKGAARQVGDDDVGQGLRARRIRQGDGDHVCILAVGKMVGPALKAADILSTSGISATVWDVRVVRPLDAAMLDDAARHRLVVTVEDGIAQGGAGSAMAGEIMARQTDAPTTRVEVLGVPVQFIPQGRPDQILARLGLDADGIVAAVRRLDS
jgi:1-deoxy-D-xylulose-5-phosphate synthase